MPTTTVRIPMMVRFAKGAEASSFLDLLRMAFVKLTMLADNMTKKNIFAALIISCVTSVISSSSNFLSLILSE